MNVGLIFAAALGVCTAGAAALFLVVRDASLSLTNPPGYSHQPGLSVLPVSAHGQDPQADIGLAFNDVSFPTEDGTTLRGWLVPGASPEHDSVAPRVGVVTVHGRGSDRREFLRHLPMLNSLGATTLLFDLREHGLSDGAGRGMSLGFREAADVQAAVRYLKSTGVQRVVVLGVSLGAGSAIVAAATDSSIDAVVAESPFTSMQDYIQQMSEQRAERGGVAALLPRPGWWPRLVVAFTLWRIGASELTAPIDVVDQVSPRPLVLMHGSADTAFLPRHSMRLFERARMPKEVWIADDATHTHVFDVHPDEYRDRLASVFQQLSGPA